MSESDQDQRGIATAIAAVTGLFRQLLDFGRGQVTRVRSSELAGLIGTDRFSLRGSASLRCTDIGVFLHSVGCLTG
jgi:hypothetical protein